MRLLRRTIRLGVFPVLLVARLLKSSLPTNANSPKGLIPKVFNTVDHIRSAFAPYWRRGIRWMTVAIGFGVYFLLQALFAYLIGEMIVWIIVAFFVVCISFLLAAARPFYAFLVWLFLSPFAAMFLRLDFGKGVPAISLDRIAILFLGLFLILRTMANRQPIRKVLYAEGFYVIFIAGVIISSFTHEYSDIRALLTHQFDILILSFIVYYVTKASITDIRGIRSVLLCLIAVGVLSACFGVYESVTGKYWFSAVTGLDVDLQGYKDIGTGRSRGPFGNPVPYGTFLTMASFICIHFIVCARRYYIKLFLALIALFMMYGCYLCYTRGAYLAFGVLIIVMPFLMKGSRRAYVLLSLFAMIILLMSLPFLMSEKQFEQRMTNERNINNRIIVNASLWNAFKHNMWFGVGIDQSDNAVEEYLTSVGNISGMYGTIGKGKMARANVIRSHNSLVTILVEQGLVGMGIYMLALGGFFFRLYKIRSRLSTSGFYGKDLVGLIFGLNLAYTASILTYDVRYFKYPHFVFWVLIALVIRVEELFAQEQVGLENRFLDRAQAPRGLAHA